MATLNGNLPPKVLGLVVEWAAQHQQELLNDWELAQKCQTLNAIKPLL